MVSITSLILSLNLAEGLIEKGKKVLGKMASEKMLTRMGLEKIKEVFETIVSKRYGLFLISKKLLHEICIELNESEEKVKSLIGEAIDKKYHGYNKMQWCHFTSEVVNFIEVTIRSNLHSLHNLIDAVMFQKTVNGKTTKRVVFEKIN